jgi:hypothetical protein
MEQINRLLFPPGGRWRDGAKERMIKTDKYVVTKLRFFKLLPVEAANGFNR